MISLRKSLKVSLSHLRSLPDPEPTGRFHRPLRFDTIVDSISNVFGEPGRMSLGINPKGSKLFGFFEYEEDGLGNRRLLAFRSSTDGRFANRVVLGKRVIICDNGLLSGDEIVLNRKSTTNFELEDELSSHLPTAQEAYERFTEKLEEMKSKYLDPAEASYLIVEAMRRHALSPQEACNAAELYFKGDAPESAGFNDTRFALFQSFTRQLLNNAPSAQFRKSVACGRLFGL